MKTIIASVLILGLWHSTAHSTGVRVDSLDPKNREYLNSYCAYHPKSSLCFFTPNPPVAAKPVKPGTPGGGGTGGGGTGGPGIGNRPPPITNCAQSFPSITPGTKFPSQKLAYTDPVSGKRGWRMTTIGKQFGASVVLGQDAAQESNQWSSDSRRLTFSVACNSRYPKGIYMVEIDSGVITYLAPTGNATYTTNSRFNNANPSEVIYFYAQKGKTADGSFVDIRAVNISSFTQRTIATYPMAFDGTALTQSANGKWIGFVLHSGNPASQWGSTSYLAQNVILNQQTGQDHLRWAFSTDPKRNGAQPIHIQKSDGAYWNPVHASKVWTVRWMGNDWKRVYADVETGQEIPHSFGTAHSGLHPNGELIIGDWGIRDTANKCLSPQCGQGTPYRTGLHAFVDPSAYGKGWDAEVVMDGASNGLIYRFSMAEIRDNTFNQNASQRTNVAGTFFGTSFEGGSRGLHPHIQYSPNGRYLAWMSNIRGPQKGAAPGPNDGNLTRGDIFVLDLQ